MHLDAKQVMMLNGCKRLVLHYWWGLKGTPCHLLNTGF